MKAADIKNYLSGDFQRDLRTIRTVVSRENVNGYLGWTGHGNLGDEAVYEGYRRLFPEENLIEMRVNRPVDAFISLAGLKSRIKSVALGGGTLINQSEQWLAQVKYFIKNEVPIYCLGTGVASRDFWKNHEHVHTADDISQWVPLLKKFLYAGVRGPLSQKSLADAGFQAEVVGDVALTLAKDGHRKRTEVKIVGVNISSATDNVMWGDPRIIKKEIVSFVRKLIRDDIEVRLLPIWIDDLSMSAEIIKEVGHKSCKLIKAYDSIETYMQALEECDMFVGLKLHATVFATMLRIPSIMLEYRPKCLDYMESIGMGEYSIRTDIVSSEVLFSMFQKQIRNYDSVVNELDKKVLFYKNLQYDRAKEISRSLKHFGK